MQDVIHPLCSKPLRFLSPYFTSDHKNALFDFARAGSRALSWEGPICHVGKEGLIN